MVETRDVVVVGARCAGSAAAIALAQRGRDVVALDGASFPSDTLSTHLFFPNHWAELDRLGALPRVMKLDPPLHTTAGLWGRGVGAVGSFAPYEGIAYGSCVRRPGLDLALVETAREAGAEVREQTRVIDLVWEGERVVGVTWKNRAGEEGTIRARLVIGADGRRSSVARLVGTRAHHEWKNRRLMAFAYYEDTHLDERSVAMQWRHGRELVTNFPCDGGLTLVLAMSPVDRAEEYRDDADAAFERTVAGVRPLAERLVACQRVSKVRTSLDHPSYFRHSQGPGWALAGDAGHFKDPVTAQGIRDALRFGRLLGEAVAPALDDDRTLDAALAAWEADRDGQCLGMYQWANGLGLDDEVSPIEFALYSWMAERPERPTEALKIFSRLTEPSDFFTPRRLLGLVRDAARHPDVSNADLARTLRRDVGRELSRRREERRFARRRKQSADEFRAARSAGRG